MVPGERIGGLEVLELLGEGGQGAVYRARDESGGEVALKVVSYAGRGSAEARRFERELRVLSSLEHPHLVRLLDYRCGDEIAWAAFELIQGVDLYDVLEAAGPMPESGVRHIVRQVLEGLAAAHRLGLVHRDIKPANIRLTRVGADRHFVKLLDFGVARSSDGERQGVTKTGELVGTPRYMAPEQLTAQAIGPSADIYAVGLVATELLFGPAALPGSSLNHQLERLTAGYRIVPDGGNVSAELREVLTRMTHFDPAARYSDAAQALRALNGPKSAPAVGPASSTRAQGPLIGAAVVVVLGVGGWAVWSAAKKPGNEVAPAEARRQNPLVVSRRVDTALPLELADTGTATEDAGPPSCGAGRTRPQQETVQLGPLSAVVLRPKPHLNEPVPTIFVFNDATDPSPESALARTKLGQAATERGYMVVAPYHNTPGNNLAWIHQTTLARNALSDATEELCVDTNRRFALGLGNGGWPVEEMRCDETLRAIAVDRYRPNVQLNLLHAAQIPPALSPCDVPIPYLYLSPTDDCHWAAEGGEGCNKLFARTSIDEQEKLHAVLNDCGAHAERRGDDWVCKRWECAAPFESCRLDGEFVWRETSFPTVERILDFFDASGSSKDK